MIQQVRIQNFQAHRDTVLNLHPGLNVITGPSDSGKSSIMRALVWLIRNRPTGGDFKSWFSTEKDTVKVSLDIGSHVVVKSRSSEKNVYQLTPLGQKTIRFEALRTDMPQEVEDALNLAEHNLQTQHQNYFLLQDTPGEVARKMNELVKLEIIDRIFKNINSRILGARKDVARLTTEAKVTEEEIHNLAYVDQFEEDLAALQERWDRLQDLLSRHHSLCGCITGIKEARHQKSLHEEILKAAPTAERLQKKLANWEILTAKRQTLQGLVEQLRSAKESLASEKQWLKVETLYDHLRDKMNALKGQTDARASLEAMISQLTEVSLEKARGIKTLGEAKQEYTRLLKQIKLCPTCGAKVTETAITNILERI